MPRRAAACELVANVPGIATVPDRIGGSAGVTGPDHEELPERRRLLERDEALLVQLEEAKEVHHDLHAGRGRSRQLPEAGRRAPRQRDAERFHDLGHGDLVHEDVVDLDVGERPGLERPQGRRPDVLRRQKREQVRLQALEPLVQPCEARPRLRRGQLGGRQPDAGGGERGALDKSGEQVVTLL